MKFILGKKLNMTQVFTDEGNVIPVTKVQAGPCFVTLVRKDNNSVQIGYDSVNKKRLAKPQVGHLKELESVRFLREFKIEDKKLDEIKRGDKVTVATFEKGDKVTVTGVSKGKGFQGVVKRYNFKGGPASHGHKDQLRMPGSIGATGPQKVFKGTRMGGRMGGDQISILNLEIVDIDFEKNELLIKGAVPGARNGLVYIKAEGELKIHEDKKEEVKVEENKAEEKPVEEVVKEEVKVEEKKAEEKPVKEEVKVEDKK